MSFLNFDYNFHSFRQAPIPCLGPADTSKDLKNKNEHFAHRYYNNNNNKQIINIM